MNQFEIIAQLNTKYGEFVQHINQMGEKDYLFSYQNKWNAAQQLNHLVLCVQPLVYVYSLPRISIEEKFGRIVRINKTYDELKEIYLTKLEQGGKAPEQFIPQSQVLQSKAELVQQLTGLIAKFNEAISKIEPTDFESLQIPHPVLGLITLKEMAYNAIYHVEHHQKSMVHWLSFIS